MITGGPLHHAPIGILKFPLERNIKNDPGTPGKLIFHSNGHPEFIYGMK